MALYKVSNYQQQQKYKMIKRIFLLYEWKWAENRKNEYKLINFESIHE